MRAIDFDGPGDADVLSWVEVPDPQPQPGQALLDVAATSVNRADILQRRGHYPPPAGASPILGLEAAGTVRAAAGEWAVGDQVMALLAGGGYAEQVAVDAGLLLPVPAAVGLPAAGGLMEVFLTAYLNLIELGRLRAGERVLIHGGGGGVGTAAVQVAAQTGAEVWVTAGGPAKLARCRELGAHTGIAYREEDFVAALKRAGGADLILDCIGAKYLERNLDGLAPDGRLVIIGLQGGVQGELNLLKLLGRRLSVIGSTLRAQPLERKRSLIRRFREAVWPWFDAGRLRVVVDRELPLPEAAAGHRRVEASEHFGKVLLVRPPVDRA